MVIKLFYVLVVIVKIINFSVCQNKPLSFSQPNPQLNLTFNLLHVSFKWLSIFSSWGKHGQIDIVSSNY